MNRTTRTVIAVATLLGVAAMASPSAAALSADDAPDDDDGTKFCKRVNGFNTCAGVLYDGCVLWLSAGFGGCLTVGDDQ